MQQVYPAILFGGPPNSGKSVLVKNVTAALRQRQCPHYVLRAAPDGEGDWFYEVPPEEGRALRKKGPFTAGFVNALDAYLSDRHYPLLVDVGGRPTPEQARVFRHCTHAVLLVGDRADDPTRYASDRQQWLTIFDEQAVPLLADLRSVLQGDSTVEAEQTMLRGTLTGLERRATISGPLFDRLLDRLEPILTAVHVPPAAHVEYTLDLPLLARQLGSMDGRFTPDQLPALRAFLPEQVPLALFGRGPNWVYATLAEQTLPEDIWLFDARLGWIEPPHLRFAEPEAVAALPAQFGWGASVRVCEHGNLLEMNTQSQMLEIDQAEHLPLPLPPDGEGVILSGKVPNWLLVAAVRRLVTTRPWVAVYQPPLGGAVVVASQAPDKPVGAILPLATTTDL